MLKHDLPIPDANNVKERKSPFKIKYFDTRNVMKQREQQRLLDNHRMKLNEIKARERRINNLSKDPFN